MANVSYREDIHNRYLSSIAEIKGDVDLLRTEARNNSITSANAAGRLKSMARVCDQLIIKLDRLTDVATHPWISAAQRYFEAQLRVEDLAEKLQFQKGEYDKQVAEYERSLERNDAKEIDVLKRNYLLKDEVKKLKEENMRLKEEVALNRNPKALFGTKVNPLKK